MTIIEPYYLADLQVQLTDKVKELINEVTDDDQVSPDCRAEIYILTQNCYYLDYTEYPDSGCDIEKLRKQVHQIIKKYSE